MNRQMNSVIDQGNWHRMPSHLLLGIGGFLTTVSMFFRFVYGPMGGVITYYGILSGNFSWDGWPMMIAIWPLAFGIVELTFALFRLVPPKWIGHRIHWVALITLFVGVLAGQVTLIWKHGGIESFCKVEIMTTWIPSLVAVIVSILAMVFVPTNPRKSAVIRLIGVAWVLFVLFPITEWTPLRTILWAYGLGYWLMIFGMFLFAAASIMELRALSIRRSKP